MAGKNYTVMELAEQIGVPRTTINDWLSRYSQYIETVPQGKRKVYPETALNVLREIAAMRNAGKAFAEIETELSARHPIRAVPVTEEAEEKKSPEPQPGRAPEQQDRGNDPAAGETNQFAIQPREQAGEIGHLIGDSFRSLEQRIRELEDLSRAQRRMSVFWLGACALFLVVLAGGSLLAWHFLRGAEKENLRLLHRQRKTAEELSALKEQSVELIVGNKTFQANIVRLEAELKQQKKDFEQSIQTEKKRLTELHQARQQALLSERDQARMQIRERETNLALEKEKFAAKRLKLLTEMEKLKEQQKSLAQENLKLKEAAKTAVAPKQEPPEPAKAPAQPDAAAAGGQSPAVSAPAAEPQP